MTAWALIAAAALLAANAFFVAVEFAVIASRQSRLEPLAADGSRRAVAALSAVRHLSLQLSGAQLGITMASLGLGAVAEPAVADLIEPLIESVATVPSGVLHTISFVISLAIVVFLHMVLGEMVPKNVAIAGPERTLLWLALPNRAYLAVFGPVVRALNWLGNLGVRALGFEPRDELGGGQTVEELGSIVAASHEEGLIEPEQSELLGAALLFGQREVGDIAVPRGRVDVVDRHATIAEVEDGVARHGHTRLPVVDGTIDDTVGFVHVKDVLPLDPSARSRPIPERLIRPVVEVVGHHPLESVLRSMRRQRTHVALVRRGHRRGRVLGIVTLEDVVEALVGDIRDETDRQSPR
jgi:CBS domain containing-hemolysin-like protein